MDADKETFETWNKVAELYQEKFMDLDIYDGTYDDFCKNVPGPNASVLEIGCGPGNVTKYLLSKRPDFKILGTDFAPNMVALARVNNPSANFLVMDCRRVAEINEMYDGIMCAFCAPYLSHQEVEKLISDCYQLLNKEGCLYLSFVEGDPADSGWKAASTGDRTYFYYHAMSSIEKAMIDSGFASPIIFTLQYAKADQATETHIVLIARKS